MNSHHKTHAIRQVVIGVCTNEKGEFLLAYRKPDDKYGNQWELPGGGVEDNESQRQALKREWKEELGVDIKVTRKLGSIYGIKLPLSISPFNLHIYAVRIFFGQKPQPLESQALRWVEEKDISFLNRNPFVDTLIAMYRIFYPAK